MSEPRGQKRTKCIHCRAPARQGKTECVRCNNLKARYGITTEDWWNMFHMQEYTCANPNCDEELTTARAGRHAAHVDHDHETGEVRGLLCSRCNKIEGFLPSHHDDAVKLIAGLLEYLNNPPGVPNVE